MSDYLLFPIMPPNFEVIFPNIIFPENDDEEEDFQPPRLRRPPVIRERYDYFNNLSNNQFKLRFRLEKETVLIILAKIADKIRPNSDRNNAISPLNRLLLTLRFLATGYFFICAGDTMGISKTSAHDIIQLVIEALVDLRKEFIHFPSSQQGIQQIVRKFFDIAKFPRVVGAIDCTHIRVQSPGEDGWLYYNRKGWHSKNVQVVAGPDLKILNIVTRWPGRFHDMTVFNASRLKHEFETPNNKFGRNVLLGDGGYECRKYILTPLSNPTTPAEEEYNKRFISTRMTVERLFGVWKRRFPILSIGIRVSTKHQERIDKYIVAAAVLHNIAIMERDSQPLDDPNVTVPQGEVHDQQVPTEGTLRGHGHGRDRLTVRNELIRGYFNDLARH